jgi:DNA adenine methylase
MGSKRRIASEILPIILANRQEDQWYVEPFCGGCNLIDKVPQGIGRIAADIHEELIAMFKALQEGWKPPTTLTEFDYKQLKQDTAYAKEKYADNYKATRAVTGFAYSYAAKWFGGYCRGFTSAGVPRDYIMEGYRNVIQQVPLIKEIQFLNIPYFELELPNNSLIYCDPPYKGTTSYKDKFNHEDFYKWCREKKAEGHTIFISEYFMPEDFTCVWHKEQVSSLTQDTGSKVATERLFTL